MASYSQNTRWGQRARDDGISLHVNENSFETKRVDFQGHLIEVSIPTGSLADYMFERGIASRA